jgi:hypothetical protein
VDIIRQRRAGLDVHKDEVAACARVVTGRGVPRLGTFLGTLRSTPTCALWAHIVLSCRQ